MRKITVLSAILVLGAASSSSAEETQAPSLYDSKDAETAFQSEASGVRHLGTKLLCPSKLGIDDTLTKISTQAPAGLDFSSGVACEYTVKSYVAGFVIFSKHTASHPEPLSDSWCRTIKPGPDANSFPAMPWDQHREPVSRFPQDFLNKFGLAGKEVWTCGMYRGLYDPKGYVVFTVDAVRVADWDVIVVYRPPARIVNPRAQFNFVVNPEASFWSLMMLADIL